MPWLQLLTLLLLIALNGFLVMSELAIVSSRPARLQMMAAGGSRGAEAALRLNGDSARFLPSVQIGITVVAILSGAYGEVTLSPQLAELLGGVPVIGAHAKTAASAIVVAGIAYVSLVIGELVPEALRPFQPRAHRMPRCAHHGHLGLDHEASCGASASLQRRRAPGSPAPPWWMSPT